MIIGLYCPRCGGEPIIRLHRVRKNKWLEKSPRWRSWDCGSLKCAVINYLGGFVGWHATLKTVKVD